MTTIRRLYRWSAMTALAVTAAAVASAQAATVAVTTDSPTGLINPGQTMRVTTTATWVGGTGPGWFLEGAFAGLRGSTINTPPALGALGIARGEIDSDFTSGLLVSLGGPVGGSLAGLDIAASPPYFSGGFMIPPIWNHEGVVVHSFDWTAPTGPGAAGVHRFDFVTPAIAPNFRLYAGWTSPVVIEVPTTFIGASILVVPAPASALLLAAGAAGCSSRRRP